MSFDEKTSLSSLVMFSLVEKQAFYGFNHLVSGYIAILLAFASLRVPLTVTRSQFTPFVQKEWVIVQDVWKNHVFYGKMAPLLFFFAGWLVNTSYFFGASFLLFLQHGNVQKWPVFQTWKLMLINQIRAVLSPQKTAMAESTRPLFQILKRVAQKICENFAW